MSDDDWWSKLPMWRRVLTTVAQIALAVCAAYLLWELIGYLEG
jgi:hypothetical protein